MYRWPQEREALRRTEQHLWTDERSYRMSRKAPAEHWQERGDTQRLTKSLQMIVSRTNCWASSATLHEGSKAFRKPTFRRNILLRPCRQHPEDEWEKRTYSTTLCTRRSNKICSWSLRRRTTKEVEAKLVVISYVQRRYWRTWLHAEIYSLVLDAD